MRACGRWKFSLNNFRGSRCIRDNSEIKVPRNLCPIRYINYVASTQSSVIFSTHEKRRGGSLVWKITLVTSSYKTVTTTGINCAMGDVTRVILCPGTPSFLLYVEILEARLVICTLHTI